MDAQTKQITVAVGNTYQAKEYLKQAGFKWSGERWYFPGIFDTNIWTSKYANPSWGRKIARLCEGITFRIETVVA